jgi:hypothetical protein
MKPLNLLDKILRFLLYRKKTTQQVLLLTRNGKWTSVGVADPISFSELNDLFGDGNWKL